jgi:hypothetical protein
MVRAANVNTAFYSQDKEHSDLECFMNSLTILLSTRRRWFTHTLQRRASESPRTLPHRALEARQSEKENYARLSETWN